MESIGIVRKLDELGRIVIPKEMRKLLNIKECDALEIFQRSDREIVLKKYSEFYGIASVAETCAKTLNELTGHVVFICSDEKVMCYAGIDDTNYVGYKLSQGMMDLIQNGTKILLCDELIDVIPNAVASKYVSQLIYSTKLNTSKGAIILVSKNSNSIISDYDFRLCEIAEIILKNSF